MSTCKAASELVPKLPRLGTTIGKRVLRVTSSRLAFLGDQRQSGLLRVGELLDALRPSARLPASAMSTCRSISSSTACGRQLVDLPRERAGRSLRRRRSSPADWSRCRCRRTPRRTSTADRSGFFVPVLAKMISCCSGSFLSAQNCWFICQMRLALTMPTMPCACGDSVGHVLLGVDVDAADEDAVDGLERVELACAAAHRARSASRAASYCRGEKISVTLSVTPAAASSSSAARPAGVAGTLIMRFLWPGAHFLPSSTYCAAPLRDAAGLQAGSSSSGSSSKLT